MKRTRIDWILVAIAIVLAASGCGGGCGGCTGIEPIPGGFPANQRIANAGQVRVAQGAFDFIESDPAGILGGLAGGTATNGKLVIDAAGGQLEIDLNKVNVSELPRFEANPSQGNSRVDVIVRARVRTLMPLKQSGCDITIESRNGSVPDFTISLAVSMTQDASVGTTRITAGSASIANFESADYSVGGAFFCGISVIIPSGTIASLIASQIPPMINDQMCKTCTTVADCGSSFATSCNADGQCQMANGSCFQELGLAGRMRGSLLFAGLSPGTTGAIDLYEVAGGYATSNNNGIALGLLGNMLPAGSPRDRCGPPAVQPAKPTIAQSTYFQGNTRPDTNAEFDVGIGLHKSQLDALAYAGYDGGLFCLTIGSSTVSQLSTDTISLLSRSLGKLVETNSPMAIGLRPQSAPTIALGANTFKDEGGTTVPDEPLLDISFTALEIDFFASIDEQWIRVFTVVADVHLGIGLQTTTMGELTPVLGNTDNAFTNVTVKNSEAITESPQSIADLFPTLLTAVLPQLSGGLGSIALPEIGSLKLNVTDVTAVDNKQFLAIYADLAQATMPRLVQTSAELEEVVEPSPVVARTPSKWGTSTPPMVRLNLDGNPKNVELSYRVDGGFWSGWSTNRHPAVSTRMFWAPGLHKIEVRAREIGNPATMDRDPAIIEVALGTDVVLDSDTKLGVLASQAFHGQAGSSGCSCETSSPTSGALFALVIAGLVLIPRRRRRAAIASARRLGLVTWLAALLALPGCDCGGSNPCGDVDCLTGEVEHGLGGRWTSIAADDKRVLVATYDNVLGDLMVVDGTNPSALKYVAVDGIPEETPVYEPDTYRGGIEGTGPNVGAWTSIQIAGGLSRVAYQDRDAGTLKYAMEEKAGGTWQSHVVDGGDVPAGMYASMVMDGDGRPAIAYLALGIDDGAGHRVTELRLARSGNANPDGSADWTHHTIATAPGTCGGLCGSEVCAVGAAETDPQTCVTPSTDCGMCGDTEVCVTGTCRERIDAPKVVSLPGGTGLYVSLVALPDGRLAAAHYDMNRRALVLAVEGSRGGNDFSEAILDGNAAGADRGMWSEAVAGSDGTVHIAYQDALGDQLFYTSWNGSPGAIELVDDGTRSEGRTHNVGAGTAIYLDGGSPVIAYQDGLVSDTMLASRASGSWTKNAIGSGALLDGFSVAATTGKGSPMLAWGTMDPALAIPMTLTVRAP